MAVLFRYILGTQWNFILCWVEWQIAPPYLSLDLCIWVKDTWPLVKPSNKNSLLVQCAKIFSFLLNLIILSNILINILVAVSVSLTKLVQQNRIECRTFCCDIGLTHYSNISNTYLYVKCFVNSYLLDEELYSCLFAFSLDQSLCVEWTIPCEPVRFSIDSPHTNPYYIDCIKYIMQQSLSYLESILKTLSTSSKSFLIMRSISSSLDC